VLLGPDEFPANVYPWLGLRQRGVEVEFLGERGSPLELSHLEDALRRPGRVRLLSLAAVYYLSGDIHPLADFARLVHEREALLVVDATQAVGCVAINWRATGADAILSSGYKWLLGPYGTGCAWMRQSLLAKLHDVGGNWWANEKARDLRELLTYAPVPVHGTRLDSGETASFLNLAAVRAGLDYLLECGVAKIEAHQRALHDRLTTSLNDLPVEVVTGLVGEHRSPMLFLRAAGDMNGERLQTELAKAHIRLSVRGGKIRVSPGVWSQEEDIDKLAEALHRVTTRV
jgi:cysteine desulfurase/selenocysteine lyase